MLLAKTAVMHPSPSFLPLFPSGNLYPFWPDSAATTTISKLARWFNEREREGKGGGRGERFLEARLTQNQSCERGNYVCAREEKVGGMTHTTLS